MKIAIVENGPVILKAEGPVSLRIGATSETKEGAVALCRCGQSSKKPFCDGTHRKVGFEAAAGEIDLGD
jgi:CDGSH-type Zn-finger protein